MLRYILFVVFFLGAGSLHAELRIVFPEDESVIDVKKQFGAVGDGKTDDTGALQAALDAGSGKDVKQHKIVYLPNGTYRVRDTLVVNREKGGSGLGPWLYGESRDGVVIRLDDGVKGVTSVLRTHPLDEGKTSANWFMRTVRNLTIDAGDNPDTDGIRWYATNTGLLKDVRIVGNGPRGIHSSFIAHNGPNLVQDVEIDGFETGIVSNWFYGQTLSRVTILNCRKVGVQVTANAVGIESLTVRNTPKALDVVLPKTWHWWSGVVALVGGDFRTTEGSGPAITSQGKLYVRDVKTSGYASVINEEITGPNVDEYSSSPVVTLHEDTEVASPRLPIENEPVEWETDLGKWVSANDFGIIAGDRKDDSAAFQRAFDEAARVGATTVSIRSVTSGGKTNWYNVNQEVRIHGSVRHVIGLGFARILGGEGGRFVVDDASAPIVAFRHIDSLGGTPLDLVNRSKKSTMVVESCSVGIIGNGAGKIFATNVPGHFKLLQPGQPCWVRSLNAEGTAEPALVENNGAQLWVMGTKSEGSGVRFLTRGGGTTEIFGGYEYATYPIDADDRRPIFLSKDSTLFAAGIFEVSHVGKPYVVKLRDTRNGVTEELDRQRIGKAKLQWNVLSTQPGK